MIETTPGVQKLHDKIFYFPNFLSKEEVDLINLKISETESKKHYFDEIEFGTTTPLLELFPIWEKISEVLAPEYVTHPLLTMLHFKEGASMAPHCDSPGEGNHEDLTLPDVWSTCCLLEFGVIVYFGEFTGGEVYYPNQNITIPVQPGDLVIHGALDEYSHGVKEVLSGSRYAYSNFSLRADKNPGTFYNYGTEKYKEVTSNKELVDTVWQKPIFNNPDIIVMEPVIEPY
jgi:hypothetical protein